jgi:hypothetical protein
MTAGEISGWNNLILSTVVFQSNTRLSIPVSNFCGIDRTPIQIKLSLPDCRPRRGFSPTPRRRIGNLVLSSNIAFWQIYFRCCKKALTYEYGFIA